MCGKWRMRWKACSGRYRLRPPRCECVEECALRTKRQSTKEAEPATVFCWPSHNRCVRLAHVQALDGWKVSTNLHGNFCTVAFTSRRTPRRAHFNSMHLLLNSRLEIAGSATSIANRCIQFLFFILFVLWFLLRRDYSEKKQGIRERLVHRAIAQIVEFPLQCAFNGMIFFIIHSCFVHYILHCAFVRKWRVHGLNKIINFRFVWRIELFNKFNLVERRELIGLGMAVETWVPRNTHRSTEEVYESLHFTYRPDRIRLSKNGIQITQWKKLETLRKIFVSQGKTAVNYIDCRSGEAHAFD